MIAPQTLSRIHPAGGALAYLVRFQSHQILVFGGMNYIERELQVLHPDVVLVGAAASRKEIDDYTFCLQLRAQTAESPPELALRKWGYTPYPGRQMSISR
jgi:hypothetical protein